MAFRPIYIPSSNIEKLVDTHNLEFIWFPGLSISQKQKSIKSLHDAAIMKGFCNNPLDVSSKSPISLGVELSAFNLSVYNKKLNKKITVESAFQSSKVFTKGGPYKDLLYASSLAAKKDHRLINSGTLTGFIFFNNSWPINPRTLFYDWLYINILHKNQQLVSKLDKFDAFSDIEFNPKKSINCQAYSVALYQSLKSRKLLDYSLKNKNNFIEIITNYSNESLPVHQLSLI